MPIVHDGDEIDRASPGERMAGSLAGLLCTESGAGEAADRVRRESAYALLASLEETRDSYSPIALSG